MGASAIAGEMRIPQARLPLQGRFAKAGAEDRRGDFAEDENRFGEGGVVPPQLSARKDSSRSPGKQLRHFGRIRISPAQTRRLAL